MVSYALLQQVRKARSLEELADILRVIADLDDRWLAEVQGQIPSFGGWLPPYRRGILSWDSERLLVGLHPPFRIVFRYEWGPNYSPPVPQIRFVAHLPQANQPSGIDRPPASPVGPQASAAT